MLSLGPTVGRLLQDVRNLLSAPDARACFRAQPATRPNPDPDPEPDSNPDPDLQNPNPNANINPTRPNIDTTPD